MSKLRSSLRNARAHQRPRAGSDGPAAMSNGVGKLWAILVDRLHPYWRAWAVVCERIPRGSQLDFKLINNRFPNWDFRTVQNSWNP